MINLLNDKFKFFIKKKNVIYMFEWVNDGLFIYLKIV